MRHFGKLKAKIKPKCSLAPVTSQGTLKMHGGVRRPGMLNTFTEKIHFSNII